MPPLAVTPVVVAPLALLALLFPALFVGPLAVLKRWWVVLNVASVCTALYVVRFTFVGFRKVIDESGAWWARPWVFWLVLSALAAGGSVWAFRRAPWLGEIADRGPTLLEKIVLCLLGLVGLGLVGYRLVAGDPLVCPALVACAPIWIGTFYLLWGTRPSRRRPPAQAITLFALALSCGAYAILTAASLAA
jgi:hypothetical protein